tara:strand:- start:4035 stop:4229 length:195 start_codon:yes stop_codon:yes gene_type:complete
MLDFNLYEIINQFIEEVDELRLSNIFTPDNFYTHLQFVGILNEPECFLNVNIFIPSTSFTAPAA